LGYTESGKETQLDDARVSYTIPGETFKRFVELHELRSVRVDSDLIFIETRDLCALSAFQREPPSRAIDKYLSHCPTDRRKKIGAAALRNASVVDEPQIYLVN
jgi:hypothetical protein